MSHANAVLTVKTRLRLARLIVDDGWPVAAAAEMFLVSVVTARKWAARYRSDGPAGMADRSSRPRTSPTQTPAPVIEQILHLRRHRLGPAQIGFVLSMPASTVHAVLTRAGMHQLRYLDRVTAEPIRRYEHPHPGALIHVDVTKFSNIPDGGGHKWVSRSQGFANRLATAARTGNRTPQGRPRIGTCYVHTVIDDHTRLAYAEIRDNETADTAVEVLRHAVAWFAARGITVEKVLSDNAKIYHSHTWNDACTRLGITPKHTRPYRPQTNGKIERFHRTLTDGWAYARYYPSETERRQALPAWLHHYNHHRHHTAIGGPPITRLNNLSGHHK